jgi:hypothetical protein
MTLKTSSSTRILRRVPLSAALIGALCIAAPNLIAPAVAQDAPAPPELFFEIGAGLDYEDSQNEDAEVEAFTDLGIGYFTSNSRHRLSFQAAITARSNEDDTGLTDPFVSLSYARFSRDIEISGDLSYRSIDADAAELEADFDAEDLEDVTGTQEDFDVGLRLVTGRASPFGTDTALRFAEQTFSDGADGDDSITHSARSTLRFTVDPRIEFSVTGFWEQVETDDGFDTVDTTRRLSFGGVFNIDPIWTATAALGVAEIETESTVGSTSEHGPEGAFLLSRAMGNGELSFSSDHVLTEDGWRNSVRLRRVFVAGNGDVLDASFGQIFFEEGDSGHLATLTFNRTIRQNAFSVAIDYAADLDDADFLVERVTLAASLRQDLTDYSGWRIDSSLAGVEYENPATLDALRVNLGLSYLHALSNDWMMAARVGHEILYEDDAVDDRVSTVSLSFERRFSVRP